MDFVFKCWSVFTFYQCVNVKFKRHTCDAKFVNSISRVWAPCLPNFVNAFAKRPDVGNYVNVTLLGLLRYGECLLFGLTFQFTKASLRLALLPSFSCLHCSQCTFRPHTNMTRLL